MTRGETLNVRITNAFGQQLDLLQSRYPHLDMSKIIRLLVDRELNLPHDPAVESSDASKPSDTVQYFQELSASVKRFETDIIGSDITIIHSKSLYSPYIQIIVDNFSRINSLKLLQDTYTFDAERGGHSHFHDFADDPKLKFALTANRVKWPLILIGRGIVYVFNSDVYDESRPVSIPVREKQNENSAVESMTHSLESVTYLDILPRETRKWLDRREKDRKEREKASEHIKEHRELDNILTDLFKASKLTSGDLMRNGRAIYLINKLGLWDEIYGRLEKDSD